MFWNILTTKLKTISTNLHTRLRQWRLRSQSFPRRYARIMTLLELLLQLLQLIRTKSGPIPPKLRLLGTIQTRIVLVQVHPRRWTQKAVIRMRRTGRCGRGGHHRGVTSTRRLMKAQRAVGPQWWRPRESCCSSCVGMMRVETVACCTREFSCGALGCPVSEDAVDAAHGGCCCICAHTWNKRKIACNRLEQRSLHFSGQGSDRREWVIILYYS